ncbi:ABC transporter substrate-binding protein [Bacillus carboniphilus]|uniref:ABC transporter substrate-binding protein n=1 Tax=Bacillus carboniphilus TaxID=86663 RepID=UPI0035320E13
MQQWTDRDDYWVNLSEEYGVDEWEDDYVPYVFDLGKDSNGDVRALSWQTTPGGIYYRRSIAEKVLGTDDPAKVGEMLSTWDGMFEVGEKLKAEGYALFPDEGAIRWFAKGEDPQPWVNEDNELKMTDAKKEYMDKAKDLRENGYTALADEWSPEWLEGMDGPIGGKTEVFSYVLPTWGLSAILKANTEATVGDWAVTNGPNPYFWGGTWLGVYQGSENKDLAFKFVEMMTHDEEFLTDWVNEYGDVVSYLPVTEKVKGDISDEFLDGQNHYEFFLEEAESIDASSITKYDQEIDQLFGNEVKEYRDGKKTKEEAIEDFYNAVKNAYPDIETP